MTGRTETRIPCSKDTLRTCRDLKIGAESWDSLLRKMAASYDPEEHPRGELERRDRPTDS